MVFFPGAYSSQGSPGRVVYDTWDIANKSFKIPSHMLHIIGHWAFTLL